MAFASTTCAGAQRMLRYIPFLLQQFSGLVMFDVSIVQSQTLLGRQWATQLRYKHR